MRRAIALLLVAVVTGGCAFFPPPHPEHAYYPSPRDPGTVKISRTLHRAAEAVGDDPERYSFALIQTSAITAFAAEEATFYFSDGLARQHQRCIDAIVAQKVAHEVLGHAGERRVLSLAMTAGFAILGLFMPGLGLADFVVNPLVVRAYSREQELAADQRAIEILRDMGHTAPRRALADALRTAAAANPPASRLFEQRLLAIEPDLDSRLIALEPLEPIPRPLLVRKATPATVAKPR
jgi:Zn-dependent protease with chaperone function